MEEMGDLERHDLNGVYVLEVHIRGSRLRQQMAVLQALQLTIDAAQLAVLERDVLESVENLDDLKVVAQLLDHPEVVLNLIWAGNGSLRLALTVNPLSSPGRENLRYIFAVGFLVLGFMPGGQPLALAYGFALETILQVGRVAESRWIQQHPETVPVQTIDADALKGAIVELGWTPPGRSWVAPTARVDDAKKDSTT